MKAVAKSEVIDANVVFHGRSSLITQLSLSQDYRHHRDPNDRCIFGKQYEDLVYRVGDATLSYYFLNKYRDISRK